MSRTHLTRKWSSIAVAALFLITILPAASSQSTISPLHEALTAAEADGVVPGEWAKMAETVRFHMHTDEDTPPDAIPTGDAFTSGFADYEPAITDVRIFDPAIGALNLATDESDPQNNRVLMIGARDPLLGIEVEDFGAHFSSGLALTEDIRVYEIGASAEALCTAGEDGAVGSFIEETYLFLRVYEVKPDGSKSQIREIDLFPDAHSPVAPTELPTRYVGSDAWGNPAQENGRLVKAGSTLEFHYLPNTVGMNCVLYFDTTSFPAWVDVRSDSSRVATWAENAEGDFTVGLPDASKTQASERRFSTVIAHASAWPEFNTYNRSMSGERDYQDQYSWGNGDLKFRIRDLGDPSTGRDAISPPFVDGASGTGQDGSHNNRDRQFDDEIQILNSRCPDALTWDDNNPSCAAAKGFSSDGIDGPSFIRKLPVASNIGDSLNMYRLDWAYPGGANALPNGDYRFEVVSDDFGLAFAPTVTFGLKQIDVELDGPSSRLVNAGEPVEFRFTLKNTGAEDDTITVLPSHPGGNWHIDLSQRTHFLRANGGESTFTITVTPPATATIVDVASVTVAFASTFAQEVDIDPVTFSVAITTDDDADVIVESPTADVTIQPGQNILVDGITVYNNGHAQDHFVYVATIPAGNPGWSASVDPSNSAIHAQSLDDLILNVQAPGSATAGDSVDVTVTALRVGDATVLDSAIVTFNVVVNEAFEVEVFGKHASEDGKQAGLEIRNEAAPYCSELDLIIECGGSLVPDDQFDASGLFRMEVRNTAFVQDEYTIQGTWRGTGTYNGPGGSYQITTKDSSSSACDGRGHPDLWRVNMVDDPADLIGNAHPNDLPARSNTHNWDDLTVAGRDIETFWIELGWVDDVTSSPCSATPRGGQSPSGIYDIQIRSKTNPSLQQTVTLFAGIECHAGCDQVGGDHNYAEQVYDVSVGLAPGRDLADVRSQILTAAKGDTIVHELLVKNEGNELDTLTITVPESPDGKWDRKLVQGVTAPDHGPCEIRNDGLRMICTDMGVQDEVYVNLEVTASGNTLRLGDRDDSVVSVSSQKDGRFTDSIQLQTVLTGSFLFDASPVDSDKAVSPEQTVRFPFEIVNLGTAGDRYDVTLISGDPAWLPRLSESDVFVPSGFTHIGSLAVHAPAGVAEGTVEEFVLHVRSQGDSSRSDTFGFVARVRDSGTFSVHANPASVFLAESGSAGTASLFAEDETLTRTAETVTFTANGNDLPPGWNVDTTPVVDDSSATNLNGNLQWTASIGSITAPDDALATSRAILEVAAEQSGTGLEATTDVIIELADVYGLTAELIEGEGIPITPGGELVYTVRVTNQGLSEDKIEISTTPIVQAGWGISIVDAEELLGPLETFDAQIIVTAPTNAPQGQTVSFTTLIESLNDDTVQVQVPIATTVGAYSLGLEHDTEAVPIGAPGSVLTKTFVVNNTGTLVDEFSASAVLDNQAFVDAADITVEPALARIDPGEAITVAVTFTLRADAPSDVTMDATFHLESVLDPAEAPVVQDVNFQIETYRYAEADVDSDGIMEYAVDVNQDTGDGFEEFRDISTDEGRHTRVAALEQFLNDDARDDFIVEVTADNETVEVFRYIIDGDEDGRTDFFLDNTRDDLPDLYWDPDRGSFDVLETFKDVNGDSVPDYFVDTTGDDGFDAVFDIKTGQWIDLIIVDVDADGMDDYVVDANGNGEVDSEETVLYSRNGRLIAVQKIDLTGDGDLDEVYDADGDGIPDFFIPEGQEESIPIVLRDVNGDGVADWTYDADGDGERDSFYDPVTGETGVIDSTSVFADGLREYWYVAALFLVVAALFVVLLLVTRR